MEKPNFQRVTEKAIERLCVVSRPPLLLHACCAPCSSYVLEYLTQYFSITLFFCNPNITDPAEYQKRLAELRRFCAEAPFCRDVTVVEDSISSEAFLRAAAGLEDAPEAAAGVNGASGCGWNARRPMPKRKDFPFLPPRLR